MSRVFVADSDDEDSVDEGHLLSPPAQNDAQPSVPFVGTSRTTESTDSAVFRSIYEEQKKAARQVGRGEATLTEEGLKQDKGVHRGGERDPYEIPSSPENTFPSVSSTKKMAKSRTKPKPKSTPSRKVKASAFVEEDMDTEPAGRRKRRKVSYEEAQPEMDEVDLIQLPSSHRDEQGSQVPTQMEATPVLPAHSPQHPFLIAPKTLTDSQKAQYQSVVLPSTDRVSEDQGPTRMVHGGIAYASSGSATNVNTPRTEAHPTQELHMASIPEGHPSSSLTPLDAPLETPADTPLNVSQEPLETVTAESPGAAINDPPEENVSFPEEAAVPEPPKTGVKITKRKAKERRKKNQPDDDVDELNVDYSPPGDVDGDQNDAGFTDMLTLVKTRRGRGRPKKDATAEVMLEIPPEAVAPPKTTTKKKRGRPKKTEQVVEADISPVVQEAEEPVEAKTSIAEVNEVIKEEKEITEESPKEEDTHLIVKIKVPKKNMKPKPEAAANTEISKKPMEIAAEMETPKKPVVVNDKVAKNAKSTPTTGGKPIYRVGLSKRSRIAPLLKMIPKT